MLGKERLLYKQTMIDRAYHAYRFRRYRIEIDCTGFAEVTELTMVMPAINEPPLHDL